jgi:hypothetical protein
MLFGVVQAGGISLAKVLRDCAEHKGNDSLVDRTVGDPGTPLSQLSRRDGVGASSKPARVTWR